MGVMTVTTREWICDRCYAEAVYENDAEAAKAGWALLSINTRTGALCPTDRNLLDFFLMGQKSPAGMRFNELETERLKGAAG